MAKTVLITGICGFVAFHLFEHILKNTDWDVIGLDRLDTYAFPQRIQHFLKFHQEWHNRYRFVLYDLQHEIRKPIAEHIGNPDAIFHLAASSHVDDSIRDPLGYARDNFIGTVNILNYARQCSKLEHFHHFSTDETYGNALDGQAFGENDRYLPRNPYSSSKAGSDLEVYSFYNTYKLPAIISNCTNIFGAAQDGRKYIPICIRKILNGETIQIHSYPGNKRAGSRQWVHARNVAAACIFLYETTGNRKGEWFNLYGQEEIDNLRLALMIGEIIGKPVKYELVDFHKDRPGHDLRYSLDGRKLQGMGFDYPVSFQDSLEKTVQWYLQPENRLWLES